MKQYFVYLDKVKTLWELHEALKKGLNLPSYYGMNMDALWDCLTSDIEHPCIIYLSGLNSLPKCLKEKVDIMMELFNDAVNWYADINSTFDFEIIETKQYIIDFSKAKTYWYFYEAIIKGMKFPSWCGKNPDAIWDLLTGYMYTPATINIRGINTLPSDLESEMTLILKILNRAVDWYAEIHQELIVKIID